MHLRSYWQFKSFNEAKARLLQQELDISPVVAKLMVQRGIDTSLLARDFLYGQLQDLSDPFSLGGMQPAIARILQAMQKGERIVIYGDYDVDGICSIVLLKDCFEQLAYPVDYYVPGRFNEGYGLNLEAVEKLAAQGYKLVISVDCGIKSIKETATAAELGLDIIITDHHTSDEQLPPAVAIVNPKIDGNEKNRNLAGAGVAFKLVQALCKSSAARLDIYQWLDLVALATIADIVPLTGDNRIFVKYGLERLADTNRLGLQALLNECGLQGRQLLPSHIGFALAPRLNSAGRLQNAGISIELLLTKDKQTAQEQVQRLSDMNAERRGIEEVIFQEAIAWVEKEKMIQDRVLVLGGEGWHQGVTGIVASRLCDRYHRPAILISWDGSVGRGSGRSIHGFDLYQALKACSSYLQQFGGHKLAAGLTMNKDDYRDFRQAINKWCEDNYQAEALRRCQFIDLEVEMEDIDGSLLNELQRFQPCGEGNPVPVLALRNSPIYSPGLVGQGHFKSQVGSQRLSAIAFNRADLIDCPTGICYHDQCFELTENVFRGQKNLQLKIKDMKPSYWPDVAPSSGFSSGLIRATEKILRELKHRRPVLFVCPTHRTLLRQVNVLQSFFRPNMIAELHGRLPAAGRKSAEADFIQGRNQIYAVSLSYLRYYLENQNWPNKLRLLVQAWPDTIDQNLLFWMKNCEIESIDEKVRDIEWTAQDVSEDYPGRTLIYANRKRTISRILEKIPASKTEAGLAGLHQRRRIRQEFWQTGCSTLITDGSYSGCNTFDLKFDRALFADAPFSSYEAAMVMEQLKTPCSSAGILFSQEDISSNLRYLSRIYPEPETVQSVWAVLQDYGQQAGRIEAGQLAGLVSKDSGREYSSLDIFPVLNILVDLGLCQIDKKGSIIEIKCSNTGKMQLPVSRSPYHLEGKQEKQVWENFANGIKII